MRAPDIGEPLFFGIGDSNDLCYNGWVVPMARLMKPDADGNIGILLDGRMCFMFRDDENAGTVVGMVATAIALGLGLSHAPGPRDASPLVGEPSEDAKRFEQEQLRIHAALRFSQACGIGSVSAAPLGPRKVEP